MNILTLSCYATDLNVWLTEFLALRHPDAKITSVYERENFFNTIRFARTENIRYDLVITTGRCLDTKKRVRHVAKIGGKRIPFMDPTPVIFDGAVTSAGTEKIPLIHTGYGLLPRFMVKLRLEAFLSSPRRAT